MRNLTLALILFTSISAFSQNIELFGGLNKNYFHDYLLKELSYHYSSSYKPKDGYSIGIGVDNIKIDWFTLRFTLGYDRYRGELAVSGGSLAGKYTTDAELDKSVISLAVFPINFKIIDRLDFNFGFEFSGLMRENFSGRHYGWFDGMSWDYDLNDKYDRFSSKTHFGLRGRIAYDFNISDKLAISPQYSYYFGLSNEFIQFPNETKSMRHNFCLGIQRKLK
jgi:hypothetical protein